MRITLLCGALLAMALVGCAKETPMQPLASSPAHLQSATGSGLGPTNTGKPGYEPAYVNGTTVTINAIEVPNVAPAQAQADFYEVVYPNGWAALGLAPPQCNPCDHQGDGIDPTDYHDHVLDSQPSNPGHGEFTALWHVHLVVPAYSGDPTHDTAVSSAYASHLPAKSEAAVDALLSSRLPSGAPAAVEIDTQFYFLCAVVSPNAAR